MDKHIFQTCNAEQVRVTQIPHDENKDQRMQRDIDDSHNLGDH